MIEKLKELVLVRLTPHGQDDEGTFGHIVVDDLFFYTIELPRRGNKQRISCIPKGTYQADWKWSPRFKREMYLVQRVKDRWGIRFHAANFAGDKAKGHRAELLGCIALGLKIGKIYGQKAILQSRAAMEKFEKHMAGRSFMLTICDWEGV